MHNMESINRASNVKWKIFTARVAHRIPVESRIAFVDVFSQYGQGEISWSWLPNDNLTPQIGVENPAQRGEIWPMAYPKKFPEDFMDDPRWESVISVYYKLLKEAFHAHLDEILNTVKKAHPVTLIAMLRTPEFRFTPAEFELYEPVLLDILNSRGDITVSLTRHEIAQSKRNIIPDNADETALYFVALQSFFKEFMTGEFQWGLFKGITYRTKSIFNDMKPIQIT